ncbi:MAG: hypothetical protein HZA19_02000, partial [Nitrospirae bacterium]|nr:hypothetical protein [Nitrospirota bacterium]
MRKSALWGLFLLLSLLLWAGWPTAVPVHAQIPEDRVFFVANPGGDRPDDSYKYGDLIYPTDFENLSLQNDPSSRVAILQRGYAKATNALIGLFSSSSKISDQDLTALVPVGGAGSNPAKRPATADVLIIPSGGLSEIGNGGLPREALDRFVRQGGLLVVLCQPQGEDFSRLPVADDAAPLRGYGWLEDQSVLYPAAYPVSGWNPTSGWKEGAAHLNVDGFLTSLPKGASVLLRHSVNAQPVMIYYRHGKGGVLVSTLFTDWAYLHQRATREEIDLFQRMVTWALSPGRVQEAERGDDGRSVLPPLTFAVLSDHEAYTLGSTATFTMMIWNNSSQERWINVYYEQHGGKVHLLPKRVSQISYTTKIHSSHRLWVYFHDENGRFLETLTRGVQVLFTSPLELTLKNEASASDGKIKPGAQISYFLEIDGTKYEGKKIGLDIKVFDPDHRVIHSEASSIVLDGEKKAGRPVHFTLPADAVGGNYLLSATATTEEGEKIGGESATFEVPLSLISVTPKLPERIASQNKAAFAFELHNDGGVAVEKGGLSLLLKDPSGRIFYEASLPFSLALGERRSLSFKVPFSEILFGDYALAMTQWDETRKGVSVPIDLSNELTAKALFNQTVYRARDTVDLSLKVLNSGPFEMSRLSVLCSIPQFPHQETQVVSLGAHDETSLFFRFQVPKEVNEGPQEVKITFMIGGSSISQIFPLDIPSSSLSVLSKQPIYRPGEKILVMLSNTGGVD